MKPTQFTIIDSLLFTTRVAVLVAAAVTFHRAITYGTDWMIFAQAFAIYCVAKITQAVCQVP